MMEEIEISELRRLTQVIEENFDYDFKNYAMSSFRRRIKRVLELYKFKSVDVLIEKLTKNPSFFQEFVSEVTVNVTEMFRDPTFWTILREQVLPEILKEHQKVSVWHAGCSSGEEVFSMLVLLEEMGALENANIVATDIDLSIIDKAKNATIPLKNMELNQKNYERFGGEYSLSKYFVEDGTKASLHPRLLEKVSFRKHDLVKDPVFSKFDLVLCRNVMIYFNQTLQNDVLYKLHESLFRYGNLAIGSKESLIWCDIAKKFIVVNNEEKIYKKVKE